MIRTLSTVAFLYPLFFCAALYGQWLVAWAVLGHRPIPSINDPKYIPVSGQWMYMTYALMMGSPVAAVGALFLWVGEWIANRRSSIGAIVRLVAFAALWVGVYGLLQWDPGRVLYWWFD